MEKLANFYRLIFVGQQNKSSDEFENIAPVVGNPALWLVSALFVTVYKMAQKMGWSESEITR